jgi:hypothetical protein
MDRFPKQLIAGTGSNVTAKQLSSVTLKFCGSFRWCRLLSPSFARSLVMASATILTITNFAPGATFSVTNVAGLISAIDSANQNAESDTISLAAGATFTLTQVNNSTHGATGLPLISAIHALTILGNGSIIERSAATGTPNFRLFDVAANASLARENLTLQGGLTELNWPNGGAIYNAGDLALTNVTVQNNIAIGRVGAGCSFQCNGPGGPGWNASGGGIYSFGTLLLENSTVSNNQAQGGPGGFGVRGGGRGGTAYGGGVFTAPGTAILHHSIVSGNVAQGGAGGNGGSGPSGSGYGGGIYIHIAPAGLDEFTVAHVTGNTASTNYPNIFGPYEVIPNTNPLPGDFNHNGTVDAADYVVWRKSLGTFYTQSDYSVWRAHFGQALGSGSGTATSANSSVPEPRHGLLLMAGILLSCSRRRAMVP